MDYIYDDKFEQGLTLKEKKSLRTIRSVMLRVTRPTKRKLSVQEKRDERIAILLGETDGMQQRYHLVKNGSDIFREIEWVYAKGKSLGMTDEMVDDMWRHTRSSHRTGEYEKMPKNERKDNQNPDTYGINFGSGGGNRGWLRVPSKKRKNKMKNFLKLFGHLFEDKGIEQ
jgi:hypothetical protein